MHAVFNVDSKVLGLSRRFADPAKRAVRYARNNVALCASHGFTIFLGNFLHRTCFKQFILSNPNACKATSFMLLAQFDYWHILWSKHLDCG